MYRQTIMLAHGSLRHALVSIFLYAFAHCAYAGEVSIEKIEAYVDTIYANDAGVRAGLGYPMKWKGRIDAKIIWPVCTGGYIDIVDRMNKAGVPIYLHDSDDGFNANASIIVVDDLDAFFGRPDVARLLESNGVVGERRRSLIDGMKAKGVNYVGKFNNGANQIYYIAVVNGRAHFPNECRRVVSKLLFEAVSGFSPCCQLASSTAPEGGEMTEFDLAFLSALYKDNSVFSSLSDKKHGIAREMKSFLEAH